MIIIFHVERARKISRYALVTLAYVTTKLREPTSLARSCYEPTFLVRYSMRQSLSKVLQATIPAGDGYLGTKGRILGDIRQSFVEHLQPVDSVVRKVSVGLC